ncbi:lycopene cyclase family protein [Nakamurella leprariae]|uniref:Lycopene cyclase n=1 Tax=Nakamurella leprariae TaxID=2803911 RepID=A0A938YIE3_9ACTN|nr:lycopene cyclase family protein [Nakamurella leprariae]MBM9468892.1 lycopene cyclase [Nakamurella leprariae]
MARVQGQGTIAAHVAVLGLGPAGRAALHRLTARGVDAIGIDQDPTRPWRPTYAAWADEIPGWVPPAAISTTSPASAWALSEHRAARDYSVFDTRGLQRALSCPDDRVLTGRVVGADGHDVSLADGRTVRAGIVLDARGNRPDVHRAQQTAVGVVLRRTDVPVLDRTWFMDWRRDNGTGPGDPPSFLYVVPLDDERLLAEETCLVGRPALSERELRHRLHVRLAARGVRLTGDETTETVRFSVEPEPADPAGSGPLRIGARGGLMHPATGYSVAVSLDIAERLSVAVADGAADLDAVIWTPAERRVHRLRTTGLTTLLRLRSDQVPAFFEAFFRLPRGLQRAYLSRRDRPTATMAAMMTMAATMRPSLTRIAVSSAMGGPAKDR